MKNKLLLIFGIIFLIGIMQNVNATVVFGDSLDSGLKSYWTFDTNGADSIGNNSATQIYATHNSSCKLNGCYYFNGSAFIKTTANRLWNSGKNFTSNFWVNTITTSDGVIAGKTQFKWELLAHTDGFALLSYAPSGDYIESTASINTGTWKMVTIMKNSSNFLSIYVNGAYSGSIAGITQDLESTTDYMYFGSRADSGVYYTGYIDDSGIWERDLTSAEITELWNSGAGKQPLGNTVINVDLTSPVNKSAIVGTPSLITSLSITGTNPYGYTWKNATFNLWNLSGALITSSSITGLSGNQTTLTQPIAGLNYINYSWNVMGYYGNSTFSNYTWSNQGNYTFQHSNVLINSLTYSPLTTSFSSENFVINFTYDTSTYNGISGNFIYNGTDYPAIFTSGAYNLLSISNLFIPSVSSQSNVSFYFSIILNKISGGTEIYNTSSYNQTINPITMDFCTSNNYKILNYTMIDEDNFTVIPLGNTPKIDYDIKIYNPSNIASFFEFSGTSSLNNISVCLPNSTSTATLKLDSIIKYSSLGSVTRYNHLLSYTLTNQTASQNISLMELISTSATAYSLVYTTGSFIPQEGYVLEVQRKYPSYNNIYLTTETSITDNLGTAQAYLLSNNAYYQVLAKLNGVIVDIFDIQQAKCQALPCTINLNSPRGNANIPSITIGNNLQWNYAFDKNTLTLTFSFNKLDGTSSNMNLKYFMYNGTMINSSSLYSSSGKIQVNLSSYKGQTIYFQLYQDGKWVEDFYQQVPNSNAIPSGILPTLQILCAFLFLIFLAMAYTDNIAMVIFTFIGFFVAGALAIFLTGINLKSATYIGGALLVAIFVLIYKLNSRRVA